MFATTIMKSGTAAKLGAAALSLLALGLFHRDAGATVKLRMSVPATSGMPYNANSTSSNSVNFTPFQMLGNSVINNSGSIAHWAVPMPGFTVVDQAWVLTLAVSARCSAGAAKLRQYNPDGALVVASSLTTCTSSGSADLGDLFVNSGGLPFAHTIVVDFTLDGLGGEARSIDLSYE